MIPTSPVTVDPAKPSPEEETTRTTFKGELDSCIKHKSVLDDNIQKAYSLLVIGKCTDLLQSKLKQQSQWSTLS